MAYSNSSLAEYTRYSPNHSGQRTHTIDRISPHCVVGQCSIEALGAQFANQSVQASSNYGIDKNGRIGLFVNESNRSWCTSSWENDQRAVTIECASDTYAPYAMNDKVYKSLVMLCADICRRNGKTKLLWLGNKQDTLNYIPLTNEMVITVHRWFANKSCPGDWLYNRLGDLAHKVTLLLSESVDISYRAHCQTYGWQGWKSNGETAGTVGKGKRLEALQIKPPVGVELEVDAHMQKIGWRTYKVTHTNDMVVGTTGEARRLEAIKIRCLKNDTGKTLKYQVHCQTYGWMDPAKDGEVTGTVGKAKRMEAIRIWFE